MSLKKSKKSVSPRQYPEELKQKVLESMIVEGIGASEAAIRFGITSESTIRNWINKYKQNRLSLPCESPIDTRMKELSKKELEEKVKNLEKQLQYEKMRTTMLDTLIDVAEEELEISIRKKCNTKQFKK